MTGASLVPVFDAMRLVPRTINFALALLLHKLTGPVVRVLAPVPLCLGPSRARWGRWFHVGCVRCGHEWSIGGVVGSARINLMCLGSITWSAASPAAAQRAVARSGAINSR
jgi:hypothetical protein